MPPLCWIGIGIVLIVQHIPKYGNPFCLFFHSVVFDDAVCPFEGHKKIREIHRSERKFDQKITDIYATALDYKRTRNDSEGGSSLKHRIRCTLPSMGHTSAGVPDTQANAEKTHMGLATWKEAPTEKIKKLTPSLLETIHQRTSFPLWNVLYQLISTSRKTGPGARFL